MAINPATHAGGYDRYHCSEPGCPWSCAWPCIGACMLGRTITAAPLEALQAIGEHATWHERDDVRAGLVVVRWSETAGDFVEVSLG